MKLYKENIQDNYTNMLKITDKYQLKVSRNKYNDITSVTKEDRLSMSHRLRKYSKYPTCTNFRGQQPDALQLLAIRKE